MPPSFDTPATGNSNRNPNTGATSNQRSLQFMQQQRFQQQQPQQNQQQGIQPNQNQPKNDATRVTYSWLPHSTALGASSTVALSVRNASLNFPPGGMGLLGHAGLNFSGKGDEKKYNDGSEGDRKTNKNENEAETNTDNNVPISTHECRVEAALYGFGLPLQAAPISTRFTPLLPYEAPSSPFGSARSSALPRKNISSVNQLSGLHPDFARGQEWATATFDSLVSLPVRWRDLTRDACLTLNVFCEGDWGHEKLGMNINGSNKEDIGGGDDATNSPGPKVWGTTLPLFDEYGRLRSGLYKLKLYPNVLADGGMSYQNMGIPAPLDENTRSDTSNAGGTNMMPIESFLDGGATPGVPPSGEREGQSYHTWWVQERKLDKNEEDPKWKASLILHELARMESPAAPPEGMQASRANSSNNPTSAPSSGNSNAIPTSPSGANSRSEPWLDALTRERCLEILNEPDREDIGNYPLPAVINAANNQRVPRNESPAPTSSHHHTPYLIIELPTPPIPVLHEEQLYPVETSSHLRGTTGSITANELIKFHSKFRREDDEQTGWGGLGVRISPLAVEGDGVIGSTGASQTGSGNASNTESTNATTPANKAETPGAILSTLPRAQAFLYPVVQVLDHEPPLTDENDSPLDNPAQDKYRILAHDLIRGLVDPGLKPDRIQRARLERIIGSPSYHLSTEEKDLLWRFRFSLVDNRRALTKFLLAVDWTVESEVVQAAELLEQWRKRSPIEVTDALKLLGRNVAFQTSLVRSYAIETLSKAPDEELRLYLLQLVQALKYEEDVSGGTTGVNAVANAFSPVEAGNMKSRVSSLATFLIERASRNIELANFLYWYLRVEMMNPIYEARYREFLSSLKEKLICVPVRNGSIVPPKQDKSGHTKKSGGSKNSDRDDSISLWDLLTQQEQFISGIMDCQRDSLLVRGKKDAKELNLKESLESGGFRSVPNAVPLPSAPHIFVKGVNPNSVRMFKSALYPAVLDFIVDHVNVDSRTSPALSKAKKGSMYKVMVKTGDDLRQDQLVIMMIQLMDRLLKRGTLDLCLKPYSIMAMPQNSGLVEFVEGSIPVSQILSNNNNSIMAFFQSVAHKEGARHSVKPDVLQTYIRSCAGYCVITYLLGVGDRHLDNIMIQPSGHFFHIDFGFIFGRDPKPLPPAFRLTKEMVDGMGGTDSKEYRQFCSLACQAFNVLRKSAGLVLNLLHLMSDAGIEDLSNNPSADAIGVISKVEERFKLELNDEQAESFFLGLISESLSALAPRVMEMFHQLSVARR